MALALPFCFYYYTNRMLPIKSEDLPGLSAAQRLRPTIALKGRQDIATSQRLDKERVSSED